MSEWTNRNDRQADANAQYEHIMTTPAPPAMGAYIDAGVIGFVFGEMWRRGVLTPRDRRWVTLACVGAADAPIPMETHTYAALNSGDVTNEESTSRPAWSESGSRPRRICRGQGGDRDHDGGLVQGNARPLDHRQCGAPGRPRRICSSGASRRK